MRSKATRPITSLCTRAAHYLGAQFLQTRYFARDVVSLNVKMNAAVVVDALDLHDRLSGGVSSMR
jgi:hypothetical protein